MILKLTFSATFPQHVVVQTKMKKRKTLKKTENTENVVLMVIEVTSLNASCKRR